LSAAVAATKEIGVLSGIRVERRESGDAGEFAKLEAMSADELRSFLTAALDGDEVLEADGDGGSVHCRVGPGNFTPSPSQIRT
jgi:hypothetical protein